MLIVHAYWGSEICLDVRRAAMLYVAALKLDPQAWIQYIDTEEWMSSILPSEDD